MPKENVLVMFSPQDEQVSNTNDSWVVQEDETEIQYKSSSSFHMACFSHVDYQGPTVTLELLVNVITKNVERVKDLSNLPTPHLLPVCNNWKGITI